MASRNRVQMSLVIFERLIKSADLKGVAINNSDQGRYIKRLDEADAELMTKAEVDCIVASRHVRLVRIEHDREVYFCIFGLSEIEGELNGLQMTNLTPGIFASAVNVSGIQPSSAVSGSVIRDMIEDQYHGVEGFEGFELEDIAALYPKAVTYKLLGEGKDSYRDSFRILGYVLARSYSDGSLGLSEDALKIFSDVFLEGSQYLPFRNILQGIMSISWEGLFLEIYRCLEQLYAEPRIADLMGDWPSNMSVYKIAKFLEQHLSWRPKEDESLARVLESCDPNILKALAVALKIADLPERTAPLSEVIAKKIYHIRNNIVHYRPAGEKILKEDSEWDAIVSNLMLAVEDVYSKKGDVFFVEKDAA